MTALNLSTLNTLEVNTTLKVEIVYTEVIATIKSLGIVISNMVSNNSSYLNIGNREYHIFARGNLTHITRTH